MRQRFTGWHMTGILVAFFGVVVTVNFTMASYARSSFGGVVVENSYVASQEYNGWLEAAREQDKLGWTVESRWRDDRYLEVKLADVPDDARVSSVARHPLGRLPDRELEFQRAGSALFVSQDELPAGRWILRLEVTAGGDSWRSEQDLK